MVTNMKAKKKERMILIFIALCVFVAAITAVIIIYKNTSGVPSAEGFQYTADENASPWSGDVRSADADDKAGIKIPGYGEICFPKDTDTVPMTLYNPRENKCLFVFELYLDDAEEPFCTTGTVSPGDAVTEISTGGGISAGEHSLRIKILAFDPETKAPLNNAVVKTELSVI